MLRLIRDLFAPPPARGLYSLEPDNEAEGSARAGNRTRRNRATVERLITHFEDKDTRSVPGTKEP
jgi:hypothetical protein